MKKFKYRLEPLLKVKSEIEKQKQKELADTHRKVVAQKQKLSALEGDKSDMVKSQREKLSDKFSIAEMLIYARYMMRLKRQKITDSEILKVMNMEFEKKRKLLLEATTERKKFEKIKENLHLKYLTELAKRESKDADESARISHQNKSRK